MQLRANDIAILDVLERPVLVIALIARMLIGLALAIAIFLQVYMMILTDLRCEEGSTSLGNVIRCADPMKMIAATIVLLACIGLIAALFSPRRLVLMETLTMFMLAVVINFLADVTVASASWEIAMVIVSLFGALAGIFGIRRYLAADVPKEAPKPAPAEPTSPFGQP